MNRLIILNNTTLKDNEIKIIFQKFKGHIDIVNNFKTDLNVLIEHNLFKFHDNSTYIMLNNNCTFFDGFFDKINSNFRIDFNSAFLIVKHNLDKNDYVYLRQYDLNNPDNICDFRVHDYHWKDSNLTMKILNDDNITNNKVKTVLFIHKNVSFIEKTLLRIVSSIKQGELIIYNYVKALRYSDIHKVCTIVKTTINNRGDVTGENDVFADMLNIKLSYLADKNIEKLLFLDNNIYLKDNLDLIQVLDKEDYTAITHYLDIKGQNFNNLWMEKNEKGYYKSSYGNVVKGVDVETIYMNYIMYFNMDKLRKLMENKEIYDGKNNDGVYIGDFDIVISNFFTNNGEKILCRYVDTIGHIIGDSKYEGDRWCNIKDIEANFMCWLEEYVHPNCLDVLFNDSKPEYTEPISWLFETMFATPKFCKEMIELVNSYDLWSDGKNNDARLQSGYEPVPTVDVHLNQVDYRDVWDKMLKMVIAPICEKFFVGYHTKGTNICFVVKYSMDGQKHLRPHHDASAYTINIALNEQSEYTDGGTHFLVTDYKKVGAPIGTMLIHPGRCTHYHEGLPITSGTRYILVGFIE